MKIRHYYHCYAAGAWSEPVRDHFTALARAGLDDMTLTVGLVGREEDRNAARERITELCRHWTLPEPVKWTEEDVGWEQVTLSQIHKDVHQVPGEYAVLYMHTKGAYRPTEPNAAWRRSVTSRLVGEWERCTELLADHDLAGCHWIMQNGDWFFGGNFWWARASYLRHLPPPENKTRWTAEIWASLGACPARGEGLPVPEVFDLLPGYPKYEDGPEVLSDEQAMILGGIGRTWPAGETPGRIAK